PLRVLVPAVVSRRDTGVIFFIFTAPTTTAVHTLSLHDALPILRSPVLLLELAARAAAGEPRARQGSASVAQSVPDLRRMRAAALLPPLRARFLRADA